MKLHCVISARIWNFSSPFFLAFELNTERYGVSLRIQSECGKIWIRKAPNTNTFYVVFVDESQSMLPHELRMIILGNKKIPINISKLSEKAAFGFGKNHKLLTVQRGKYKSFLAILGRIYWNFTEVLYKFDLSQLKPNI